MNATLNLGLASLPAVKEEDSNLDEDEVHRGHERLAKKVIRSVVMQNCGVPEGKAGKGVFWQLPLHRLLFAFDAAVQQKVSNLKNGIRACLQAFLDNGIRRNRSDVSLLLSHPLIRWEYEVRESTIP